jgi:hypothetical protein
MDPWFPVAVGVVGGLLTFRAGAAVVTSVWRRTVGRGRVARRKVERLCANCDIGVYDAVLGAPTIKRSQVDETSGTLFTERIYVDPYFYVQAITDPDGRVVRFAVTVRAAGYHPRFRIPGWVAIRVGRSSFADAVEGAPVSIDLLVGANWAQYVEKHHLGRPGRYQEVWLALREAGWAHDLHSDALMQLNQEHLEIQRTGGIANPPSLREFRAGHRPNTYGETAPLVGGDLPFEFGAAIDDVRVLRPDAARRFKLGEWLHRRA